LRSNAADPAIFNDHGAVMVHAIAVEDPLGQERITRKRMPSRLHTAIALN
jgi:hypothetical protein